MIEALSKLNVVHEDVKMKMFMMSSGFLEGKVFD
jgi:hypothetical protein